MNLSHCRSLALLILAAGLLAISAQAKAAPLPCYTCRTEECPDLPAPPCPKRHAADEDARRKKAEDAARAQAEAAARAAAQEEARKQVAAQAAAQEAARKQAQEPAQAPVAQQTPLAPPRHVPIAPRNEQRSLLPWAVTTLVGGVLLAGAGGALLGVDGRYGDCRMPDDPMTCELVLRTQTGGVVMLAAGGASLITAGILFGLHARRPRPAVAWLAPRPVAP